MIGLRAEGAEEYRVYDRRWYILILFSLMAGTQGGVWNTFGPISTTAEDAFGWNNGDIGLLNNWGPISFIIATVPLIWALERKGQSALELVRFLGTSLWCGHGPGQNHLCRPGCSFQTLIEDQSSV